MITLLSIMFFLAIAHFVYESILAPPWRLSLRYKLFALRDELRSLKIDCGNSLDNRHYAYLQDSINTSIAMLDQYDIATVGAAGMAYHRNPEFKRHVDERSSILDDCKIPQARDIRHRSIRLAFQAIAVNSGMLLAPLYVLYPCFKMGIGLSIIKKQMRRFSAVSKPDLEKVAPKNWSVSV